ncbi:MAG: thioredoxin-like domain-containing protein, partial [Planctomycetota bacterium]
MPNLAALVERHKKTNSPFALVGLNTGDDEAAFHQGVEDFGVTWDCAYQGVRKAPIADLYQVQGYPTIYVLDAEGRIRFKDLRGKSLDDAVEKLLEEQAEKKK